MTVLLTVRRYWPLDPAKPETFCVRHYVVGEKTGRVLVVRS